MSITKNYFYSLSTEDLKLDTDYIVNENGSYLLSNINLKDFLVEVTDYNGKNSTIYSTDAIPGVYIDPITGKTSSNYWQMLVSQRCITNGETKGTVLNSLINFENVYKTGDFYTKLSSESESINGFSSENIGIKNNYNFSPTINFGSSLSKVEYEFDFYLFLHVNGLAHSDSSILVEVNREGSATPIVHPELAIAKVTKKVTYFKKANATLKATGTGIATIEWNTYKIGIGDFTANNTGKQVVVDITTDFDKSNNWEIYKLRQNNSELFVRLENYDMFTVSTLSNKITLSSFINDLQGTNYIIGKTIKGLNSKKSGPNEVFVYVVLGTYLSYYTPAGSYNTGYETSFGLKLPEVTLNLKNNTQTNIIDIEDYSTQINLSSFLENSGEVSCIKKVVNSSSSYDYPVTFFPLPIDTWKKVISKFYNTKIIVKNRIDSRIFKEYIYTGNDISIDVPKGEWDVNIISDYKEQDCYLYEQIFKLERPHFSDVVDKTTLLGKSNFIYFTINPREETILTDLKFQKLHLSKIFNNIIYHKYFPLGAYHEGNEILDSTEDVSFYGDTVTTENSLVQLTSPEVEKGLFIKESYIQYIDGISSSNNGIFTILNYTGSLFNESLNFISLDIDIITLTGEIIIPKGNYRVVSFGTGFIEIDYSGVYSSVSLTNYPRFTYFKYFWNEVYSTPVGIYNLGEFNALTNVSSNVKVNKNVLEHVVFSDYHTAPTVGDFLILQYIGDKQINFSEDYGTDGISNVLVFTNTQTVMFEIKNVNTQPFTNTINPVITYDIELDKSFCPRIDSSLLESENPTGKYLLVLLNRNNSIIHENLYDKLWNQYEIHRNQLLGDTYYNNGRKNYLNYDSNFYSGIKSQIKNLLPENIGYETPFLVLNLEEQIKDRISSNSGDIVEVVFPLLTVSNKCPIFVNDPLLTVIDENSIGKYSPLNYKISDENKIINRIGYVLHDLNLLLITDPEVVLGLSYESNRNFTLKPLTVSETNKSSVVNYTSKKPLNILSVLGNPSVNYSVRITTVSPHHYSVNDKVYIENVIGVPEVISTSNNPLYVTFTDSSNPNVFGVSNTPGGPEIKVTTNTYVTGTGITYSDKPEYEYFITYYVEDKNSNYTKSGYLPFGNKSLPFSYLESFNFNQGSLSFFIPNQELFINTPIIRVLIGKFETDPTDLSIITGVKDIKILSLENQSTPKSFNLGEDITIGYSRNYVNGTSYDLSSGNGKLFDLNNIPSTFFAGKPHVVLGNIKHKELVDQYRLTLDIKVPINKWNKSLNPTFEEGNSLHNRKLISEIAFHIKDEKGEVEKKPIIYAKVAPPIVKDNLTDLSIKVNLDF